MGPIYVALADKDAPDDYFKKVPIPGHPLPLTNSCQVYLVVCKRRTGNSALWKEWFKDLRDAILELRDRAVREGILTEAESRMVSVLFDAENGQLGESVSPDTVKAYWEVYIRLLKLVAAATFVSQPADTGTVQRASKKLAKNQEHQHADSDLSRAIYKALGKVFYSSSIGKDKMQQYTRLISGFLNTFDQAASKTNVLKSFKTAGVYPTNPMMVLQNWIYNVYVSIHPCCVGLDNVHVEWLTELSGH